MIEDGLYRNWIIKNLLCCSIFLFFIRVEFAEHLHMIRGGFIELLLRIQGICFYIFQGNSIEWGSSGLLGIKFLCIVRNIQRNLRLKKAAKFYSLNLVLSTNSWIFKNSLTFPIFPRRYLNHSKFHSKT